MDVPPALLAAVEKEAEAPDFQDGWRHGLPFAEWPRPYEMK
jgi:hypothetical protein